MQFHPQLSKVNPLSFRRLAITDISSKYNFDSIGMTDFFKKYIKYLNTSEKMIKQNYDRNSSIQQNSDTIEMINEIYYTDESKKIIEEEALCATYNPDKNSVRRVKRTVEFVDDEDWNAHFDQYSTNIDQYNGFLKAKNPKASISTIPEVYTFKYQRHFVDPQTNQVDIIGKYNDYERQKPLLMMNMNDFGIHSSFLALHFN